MAVESARLKFECVTDICESQIALNLNTQKNLDAWGICEGCDSVYLSDSSGSNKRKITDAGQIISIDPQNSKIVIDVEDNIKISESGAYQLSRKEKRNVLAERGFSGLATLARYSYVPVPEEVEELLESSSVPLKTIKITARISEPALRALSDYFGQEIEKITEEGEIK